MTKKLPMKGLYVLTFAVAAASLIYELLIARAVVFYTGNAVVWYSLAIGLYLGGIGLGALFRSDRAPRESLWSRLVTVEMALSLAGAVAVIWVAFAGLLFNVLNLRGWPLLGCGLFAAACIILIGLVGVLSGRELPLLLSLADEAGVSGSQTNRILAADYFGSLFGGCLFPLVLVPLMGGVTMGLTVSSLNLVVALGLFLGVMPEKERDNRRFFVLCVMAGLLTLGLFARGFLQQYLLQKNYYYPESARGLISFFKPVQGFPNIKRVTSAYQRIDVVRMPFYTHPFVPELIESYSRKFQEDPDYPRNVFLFIEGGFQFWSDIEEIYHEYLAHVPAVLRGRPLTRVLVLGGGDGLLLRELLKYPTIESITLVDIDPAMVQLAKTDPDFVHMNGGSLEDSRVHVVTRDAYHFVRDSRERYDAIYMDLPVPSSYDISKLYSREFFTMVRNRLKRDGFFAFSAPGIKPYQRIDREGNLFFAPREEGAIYVNTLKASGFSAVYPYVSRLERGNPEAVARLREMFRSTRTLTLYEVDPFSGAHQREIRQHEAMIQAVIDDHVLSMEEGFIAAFPNDVPRLEPSFSVSVPTWVLSSERLRLALRAGASLNFPEGEHGINSVFRPRLPINEEWWQPKKPF